MNHTNHSHPRARAGRSAQLTRQGFTLTEMLVAVGAMALLSLGVAQVFSLTTRTVAAGRRLSNLNAVASATERQMRADFSSMTSRGVMVIRNQIANNNNTVASYPADPEPRRRRIDEIIFAATGHFASLQQPITADGAPVSSTEALIYYGHGAKQDPLAANASGFNNPVNIADTNAAAPALGVTPGPGGSKVNQYAAEWTLARRAFVLAPPATQVLRAIPPGQGFTATGTFDSAKEIAGLPAVPSANRSDATRWASYSTSARTLRGATPALSSGVVDIIAMDLRTMAAQLSDASSGGSSFGDAYALANTSNQMAVGLGAGGGTSMTYQQAWMRGLLPADSDSGRRIRVETTVPDFLNFNGGGATPVQRSDQLMLTGGAFLPRCSEFIVEYSFGAARTGNNPAGSTDIGAVFWHGLDRQTGVVSSPNDYAKHVVRYRDLVSVTPDAVQARLVPRRNTATLPPGTPARVFYTQPDLIDPDYVQQWGSVPAWSSNGTSAYAFFGLNDPLYAPTTTLLAYDANGDGKYDWSEGDILQEPESLPWTRPVMLRITFTLCDPTDPSIEQTFQYIFDLPKDSRGGAM